MRTLCIHGGHGLEGTLKVQGAKNAVLPMLAATLLTDEPCHFENCPHLTDVQVGLDILKFMGASAKREQDAVSVCAASVTRSEIPESLMQAMRSSIMFLGPMLSRNGKACIRYPGGCSLGARPIDLHLRAMERLGVQFRETENAIYAEMNSWKPQTVTLMFPSVGATENLMLLCALSEGKTVLINPAREPEIVALQDCLNAMGARISGAGTGAIVIYGVKKLYGCRYRVMPDRIAAATYGCAAMACGGEICLTEADPKHLELFLSVLREMGAKVQTGEHEIFISVKKRPKAAGLIKTLPYPGFPTDIQPMLMAASLKAAGTSVFHETIFENRFNHVDGFLRMGADVRVDAMHAVVRGVEKTHGAKVQAADLRGGAALAVAALAAEGKTEITGLSYIDRGYEDLGRHIRLLGGDAVVLETEDNA